jgi:hypothetical protein
MAKHDETYQQTSANQTTALSRYEEGILARALTDLADAIRQQQQQQHVRGGRAISDEARARLMSIARSRAFFEPFSSGLSRTSVTPS